MSGSESWKKRLRTRVIRTCIEGIDFMLSGLQPTQRGELLIQVHFWGFFLGMLYTALFGKRFALQLAIFICVGILIQFHIFDGCILTRIEYHYRNQKGTVVDGFLLLLGIRITNEHRYLITVIGYSLISLAFFVIYIRECILGITCAF